MREPKTAQGDERRKVRTMRWSINAQRYEWHLTEQPQIQTSQGFIPFTLLRSTTPRVYSRPRGVSRTIFYELPSKIKSWASYPPFIRRRSPSSSIKTWLYRRLCAICWINVNTMLLKASFSRRDPTHFVDQAQTLYDKANSSTFQEYVEKPGD